MDRGVGIVAVAVAGGLIAIQPALNSRLGRAVGDVQASFLSFFVGTIALALIVAFARGGWGAVGNVRHVGLIYLTGGMVGAIYVFVSLIMIRSLGVTAVMAATIAGQLAIAVAMDHFGWLGVTRQPIDLYRVAGVALLVLAVFLIVRD